MPINNLGLNGQPILSYVDYRSYQGADIFIDLTFLDHTGTPVTPTSFSYQVDDITNAVNVIPSTSVSISSSTKTLQIPGSLLQMTHNWQGSEIFQISMKAVLSDTSTVKAVAVLELLAIQTPDGSL